MADKLFEQGKGCFLGRDPVEAETPLKRVLPCSFEEFDAEFIESGGKLFREFGFYRGCWLGTREGVPFGQRSC